MKDLKFIGIGGAVSLGLGGNCAYMKDDKSKTMLLVDCCEDAKEKLAKINAFDGVREIVIVNTHTHFDHIAGIGSLIWHCKYVLGNVKIKIVRNSPSHEQAVRTFLKIGGVDENFFEFVDPEKVMIDGCSIEMILTTHVPELECFGIKFKDEKGKYYYTGDTNDFENIKNVVLDRQVKKVYCEVSSKPFGVHIGYEDLKTIPYNLRDKLTLMHFGSKELYEQAQIDGFNVAKISEKEESEPEESKTF